MKRRSQLVLGGVLSLLLLAPGSAAAALFLEPFRSSGGPGTTITLQTIPGGMSRLQVSMHSLSARL